MPPTSWIRLRPSFAFEMPPSGALELWLQHADCGTPATGAEVAVVAPGKVFMTRGWARISSSAVRDRGASSAHHPPLRSSCAVLLRSRPPFFFLHRRHVYLQISTGKLQIFPICLPALSSPLLATRDMTESCKSTS
ncbi:hypothetical protein TRIUR3_33111 [Triticum urartu]|uniref:Uncharacterized protein n=1 Tax=Triticum urartu TaxID=4572 RepID=M7ZLT8_TRIUA|nr:hypothetical protein TRIUR3_33111 [Triticum urartu]